MLNQLRPEISLDIQLQTLDVLDEIQSYNNSNVEFYFSILNKNGYAFTPDEVKQFVKITAAQSDVNLLNKVEKERPFDLVNCTRIDNTTIGNLTI